MAPVPTRRTVLTLGDMPAVHAVRAVEFALGSLPGVVRLHVTLGEAIVDHDARLDAASLREAVALAGCTVLAVRTMRAPLPVAADHDADDDAG